jgi:hypothetical protein
MAGTRSIKAPSGTSAGGWFVTGVEHASSSQHEVAAGFGAATANGITLRGFGAGEVPQEDPEQQSWPLLVAGSASLESCA